MSEEQQEIGKIRLMEGEELRLVLHGRYGLHLEEAPPQGDFVVLTNQRLIGFLHEEGRRRQVLLPLQKVEAVEVTDQARSPKPLVTGGLLVLAALAVAWLTAALGVGSILPWLIGGILVVLGAIKASTYFVAEDAAMITFRTHSSEVALPLHTSQALRDAYLLAHRFFQVRADQDSTVEKEISPQVPPVEVSTPQQGTEGPGPGADVPAPGAASYSQESAQTERWRDI